MSKILLITDVARIGKIFGQLAVDNSVQVSIANNLEQGGKILAAETPDAVYVQTHLSGLSADILLLHLKSQLGNKLTSFFLLATPNQVSNTILAPFQGWLDTSAEDEQMYRNLLLQLGRIVANWNRNNFANNDLLAARDLRPPSTTQNEQPANDLPAIQLESELNAAKQNSSPVRSTEAAASQEPATSYPPRARLSVYSEFNNSFDNAVTGAPEPEPVSNTMPPNVDNWLTGHQEPPVPVQRSKRLSFLLWLVPVVIVAIVMTVIQHFGMDKVLSIMPETIKNTFSPEKTGSPVLKNNSTSVRSKAIQKATSSLKPTGKEAQATVNDSAAVATIKENQDKKDKTALTPRPVKLPDFIARSNPDKSFSGSNPGWEKYISDDLEYRIYRENEGIKAIQMISARGSAGISGSFLLDALKQLNIKGNFTPEASESKEGFKIERGYNTDNVRITYYRSKDNNSLQAVAITWK